MGSHMPPGHVLSTACNPRVSPRDIVAAILTALPAESHADAAGPYV